MVPRLTPGIAADAPAGAGDAALLAALQLTDSGFPSGAYTLSHGLETLVAEGWVTDARDLARTVGVVLRDRAAEADLPVLLAVHRAAMSAPTDLAEVIALDRALGLVKLAREEREGSLRVGRRLLVEGARLFPEAAITAYAELGRGDATVPGHAAVAQGLLYAAAGVPARSAALAVAAALVTSVVTVAVRLGLIGHGAAQRVLLDAHPAIVAAVDRAERCDPTDLRPSTPLLDIALARHERADVRTFAS